MEGRKKGRGVRGVEEEERVGVDGLGMGMEDRLEMVGMGWGGCSRREREMEGYRYQDLTREEGGEEIDKKQKKQLEWRGERVSTLEQSKYTYICIYYLFLSFHNTHVGRVSSTHRIQYLYLYLRYVTLII